MTMLFSSKLNYHTKQHNNNTSTRPNNNSIHTLSTAVTLYNSLKHLTLNDAPLAAPTV